MSSTKSRKKKKKKERQIEKKEGRENEKKKEESINERKTEEKRDKKRGCTGMSKAGYTGNTAMPVACCWAGALLGHLSISVGTVR